MAAATLTVPTIFTAIDKISSITRKMGSSVSGFMGKLESGAAKSNRLFRKFTPVISETTSQLFDFMKAAALAGMIVGGITFSVDSLKEYETAVQSFRTIVSDLNNQEFAVYKKEIGSVATATKSSTIDVAKAFENIAGLNADFAKTADGLGIVTKAAITLSKASGDELGVSAENLVGIMNQFGLEAKDADKAINILAAGQAVGASSITQSALAYKNFGAVAKSANITLEQSQGLIQTLAAKTIMGAEAGTALRGVTLKLQKAGLGYKSGVFNINDALSDMKRKFDKLKTAKQKDAYVTKTFGAENITAGKILLDNIANYKKFTEGVTGTSEAQKAAEINSQTLGIKIQELKNKWVNLITTNEQVGTGMDKVKVAIGFVTDNLTTFLGVAGTYVAVMGAWWAINKVAAIWIGAMNIALGIQGALSGSASIAIGSNATALAAYNITSKLAAAGTWLYNGAMLAYTGGLVPAIAATWAFTTALLANPMTWIVIGIVAAIALIVAAFIYWDEICAWFGEVWESFLGWIGGAWDKWLKYIVYAILPVFAIFDNWDAICAWFSGQWSSFTGFIGSTWNSFIDTFEDWDFKSFFKEIGLSILDFLLAPLKMVLKLVSSIPGIGGLAEKGLKELDAFTSKISVDSEPEDPNAEPKNPVLDSPQIVSNRSFQESVTENKVAIDVNDAGGNVKAAKQTRGNLAIPIKVTSTQGAR